ncbi:hypothetical protein COCOBI_10-4030 [Coccomyxa sp. Obi]|nr:hypothetical protein COCOBI_10-4030 [Coccomyxa sp. Obi]
MPEFHAVQCYQCSVFQVYAISGKAADVRGVVTGLNAKRQQQEEARDQELINSLDNDSDLHDEQQRDTAQPAVAWEDYLEEEVAEDSAGAQAQRLPEDAACYVTELPNGPQGKRKAKKAASGKMIRWSGRSALDAVTWACVRERTFEQESRPRKAQRHSKAGGIASRQHAASGQSLSEVQPHGNSQVHQPDHGWLVEPATATSGTHGRGSHSSQAPSMSSNEQPGGKVWQGASVEHPATPLNFRGQHEKAMFRWGDFQDDEASAAYDHDAGVATDRDMEKSASGRWFTNPGMQQCPSLQYGSNPQMTTSYD